MKTITIAAIKGGVAKSTTAAALAQRAKEEGKKVLVIDLDAQANVSSFLAANTEQPGSYQLLHGADPLQTIQTTPQEIDVIAGSLDLATEQSKAGSARRLLDALEPLKKRYNYCIIDTPPAAGELVFCGLMASTGVLIPLEADNSSLQGMYQIIDIAKQIRNTNNRLKILGTIICKYDGRPKINRFYANAIEENGKAEGVKLLATIRPGVAIKEAQAMQVSLYQYAPRCKPAEDYARLWDLLK